MRRCKQCGTCCKKGGPALHSSDLHLFANSILRIENCITIRLLEPAYNPLKEIIEPSETEFIKLAGKSNSWECCFFDSPSCQCTIYKNRPKECSLLKCWDTDDISQVIFKDTLTRTAVVKEKKLLEIISIHEQECPYSKLEILAKDCNTQELNKLLNLDLRIRHEAVRTHSMSLQEELFYFGRPMFQSAEFYTIRVKEGRNGLEIY